MNAKTKRERLILGAVLSIALIGLIFDRYILPADTEAAPGSPEVSRATIHRQPEMLQPIETPEARLAARLAELVGPENGEPRDLFANPTVASPQSAQAQGDWDQRQLTAVLLGPNGKGSAIIDGELIRVGMTLDGLTLVEVTQQAAVFRSERAEVIVRLTKIPPQP